MYDRIIKTASPTSIYEPYIALGFLAFSALCLGSLNRRQMS
jgi:hypothetical protein